MANLVRLHVLNFLLRTGQKYPKRGKPFFMMSLFIKSVKTGPKRDENCIQSNNSCETAPVKSFHLTTAPYCPDVHAALEPFQAGNGQLLFFDLVPNCPPYCYLAKSFKVSTG